MTKIINLDGSLLSDRRQRMEAFASSGDYAFFPGQLDFYSRVACTTSAQVASDTGTGKTLGAITLARLSGAERILVIVPRAVVKQWKKEIQRFWKGCPIHTNPRSSRNGLFLTYPEAIFHGWPRLSDQLASSFDCVILDESHIYGNPESKLTKGMLRLQAKYRYAFSATPLRNALPDLFPVLGWLSHENWPEQRSPAFDFGPTDLDRFLGSLKTGALDGWMKERVFSLNKDECSSATVPATVNVWRVPMPKEQEETYETLSSGGFGFEDARPRQTALRNFCARPQTSPKNHAMVTHAKSLVQAGEKVVIVCSRVSQTTALRAELESCGVACSRIDGTVPSDQHSEEAQKFKDGQTQVMLMGIKCAQSHSFECAAHLLIGSMEYSFSTFWQAIGRVWRVTSPRPVTIDCFVLARTIEERIIKAVLAKQDLAKKTTGLKYDLKINLTTWPSSVPV